MDLLSHLGWGYIVRPRHQGPLLFLAGSVAPDAGLLLALIGACFAGTLQPGPLLSQLYAREWAYGLDSLFHAVHVWAGLAAAAWAYRTGLAPFFLGGLFHIALDMLTHRRHIPAYFWPVSDITVPGPVDYCHPAVLFTSWGLLLVMWRLARRRTARRRRQPALRR